MGHYSTKHFILFTQGGSVTITSGIPLNMLTFVGLFSQPSGAINEVMNYRSLGTNARYSQLMGKKIKYLTLDSLLA